MDSKPDNAPTEDADVSVAKKARVFIVEPDEEAEMWQKVNERKINYTLPPRPARGSETTEVRCKIVRRVQFSACGLYNKRSDIM